VRPLRIAEADAVSRMLDRERVGITVETLIERLRRDMTCADVRAAVVLLLSKGKARLEAGNGYVVVHPVESDA